MNLNILVATPGRFKLLQHIMMDQTLNLTQTIYNPVLDYILNIYFWPQFLMKQGEYLTWVLDIGFPQTLTTLLDLLPKSRQALLFSAT